MLAGAPVGCTSGSPDGRPDLLLVVLDTVRADRLSTYGYSRPTSPNLDRLAAEGLRFERCVANGGWTLPTHASMFTGLWPVGHRATQETLVLGPRRPTLAARLAESGYATLAASANPVVSRASGLTRGFEVVEETFRAGDGRVHPNRRALERFLRDLPEDRPFFAFLNFVEPHLPYDPPPHLRAAFVDPSLDAAVVTAATRTRSREHYLGPGLGPDRLRALSQLYDAELARADELLGEVLTTLEEAGRAARAWVVVTSDHGENLGEHDHLAHVFSLHEPILRVPLVVRAPAGVEIRGTARDLAQLVDLYPTLLGRAGLPVGEVDGRDLLAEGARDLRPVAIAEYYYPRQVLSVFGDGALEAHGERLAPHLRRQRVAHDGRWKLSRGSDGAVALHDLASDPGEETDLADRPGGAEHRERLRAALDAAVARHTAHRPLPPLPGDAPARGFESTVTDPEVLGGLEALGYVE